MANEAVLADEQSSLAAEKSCLILLALAISAFAIGTTEFVMAGVLPNIAATFSVSIPAAGWLMTGYAIGVLISAPVLTALTIKLPRKHLLVGLMSLFVLGSVISALAPSYFVLMVGRITTALCHGAFFGVGSVVAADAVGVERRSRAIALMFTGLTLANIVGVPMGTLLSQYFGWRSMFWVIALLGVVGMAGVFFLVPHRKQVEKVKLRRELSMFKRPQVWCSLLVTAMGFGGVFAVFAYIAPIIIHVAGFAEGNVVWLLFLFGLGFLTGNVVGGKAGDRALVPTIYCFFVLLAIALFSFVWLAHYKIFAAIFLFILGLLGFSIVSPVQVQVMHEAKDAPTLASAANISSFNVGIALGTYLGGLAIHFGFGYISVSWVGGLLVMLGLVAQFANGRIKLSLCRYGT